MFFFDGGFKASASWNGGRRLEKALRIYEPAETQLTAPVTRGRQNVLSPRQVLMHQAFWKCFPCLRIEGRWRRVALVHLHHLLFLSNAFQIQWTWKELKGERAQNKWILPQAQCSHKGLLDCSSLTLALPPHWLSCSISQLVNQQTSWSSTEGLWLALGGRHRTKYSAEALSLRCSL